PRLSHLPRNAPPAAGARHHPIEGPALALPAGSIGRRSSSLPICRISFTRRRKRRHFAPFACGFRASPDAPWSEERKMSAIEAGARAPENFWRQEIRATLSLA
ncbi:MAG: hypothetical protein EOQ60_32730, partial [Mesorhizobium sp.]